MVLDPGGDLGQLCQSLQGYELGVNYIVLTHAHLDHGGKVKSLLDYLAAKGNKQVKLLAHCEEEEMRSSLVNQAMMFQLDSSDYEDVPEPDVLAKDGMLLALGELSFKVLHTPGHSPGHISLYFEPAEYLLEHTAWEKDIKGEGPLVFVGDVLFAGSVGRTDLPGGSYEVLMHSIKSKLLSLPEHTVVLPGHGPNTTVEREKKTNPFLRGLV